VLGRTGISSSTEPSVLAVEESVFGLKKPLRLCCPFAAAEGAGAEDGFVRFTGLLVVASGLLRFLMLTDGERAGRGAMLGEMEVETGMPLCRVCVADGLASGAVFVIASSVEELVALVLCDCGSEGLRANMSRIFLRPTNSGMSLPDKGNGSVLVEYSR